MSAAVGDADPFGTTTDADAYVPRPACEQALAELVARLRDGHRLLALTGPTGIGKTQLLRVLAARLVAEAEVLILPYAGLGFDDLCRWSLGLLGEPMARGSQAEPRTALLEAAMRRKADGRILVLALDDASGLPPASARQLTRLVAEAQGALGLVVVPIDDPRAGRVLAALGRGVHEVRLHAPMTEEETADYVTGRLTLRPLPPDVARRFDEGAIGWLHRASGGFPRELHHLAFRIQRGIADPADDPFDRREQWLEVEGDPVPGPEPADAHGEAASRAAEQLPAARAEREDAPEDGVPVVPSVVIDEPAPRVQPAPALAEPRSLRDRLGPSTPIRRGNGQARTWITVAVVAGLPLLIALWLTTRGPTEAAREAPPSAPGAAPEGERALAPTGSEGEGVAELGSPAAGSVEPRSTGDPKPTGADSVEPTEAAERAATAQTSAVAERAATAPAPAVEEPVPDPSPPALAGPASTVTTSAVAQQEAAGTLPAIEELDAPAAEPPQAGRASETPASLDASAAARTLPRIPVNLNARPWATVWIDGVERGTTPLAGVLLEEGVHHFRLVFPDGHVREAERRVDAQSRHFSFGL